MTTDILFMVVSGVLLFLCGFLVAADTWCCSRRRADTWYGVLVAVVCFVCAGWLFLGVYLEYFAKIVR